MSKRSKRVVIAMAVAMAAGVIAAFSYSGWRSTAALIPEWTVHSPDNEYRIEFYRVWTPNTWRFTAPGQSSDNIDGFIRLCRSDGTIIKEVFRTFLRVYEPRWHDDSVYFLGDDGPYWNLPRTAKQDSDGNAVKPPGVERES